MRNGGTVLYIGGFELPDKNAAAQRVIGIAKGLKELHYEVIFLSSVKNLDSSDTNEKNYFGFKCYEYRRESKKDYLLTAKTVLMHIEEINPDIVIAYNYPGVALEHIRKQCKKNKIKCLADVTEWYQVKTGSILYRIIKTLDTSYRMRIVQKKVDGIIAISRFLYNYYKEKVNTVLIPPTVDLKEAKWNKSDKKDERMTTFIYAGSPSTQKERLDLIVNAIVRLHKKACVKLNIVGILKDDYFKMYGKKEALDDSVFFCGRISHDKVIEMIKAADWAVIFRENNFVVNAGFPTKLVECISCGIPVICNKFSNICDYLDKTNSIITDFQGIDMAFEEALDNHMTINNRLFDFRIYIKELKLFLDKK